MAELALIALPRGQIPVPGVLDRRRGNQRWAATTQLASNGVELHRTRRGGDLGKLHHKLMVIDGQVIISVSFSCTTSATALNGENIVLIGDLEETGPEAVARQRQLGQFALGEIDGIIQHDGMRVQLVRPRSDGNRREAS